MHAAAINSANFFIDDIFLWLTQMSSGRESDVVGLF